MLAKIRHLREIVQLCQKGEPLEGDLARWLGTTLDDFLNQRARTIEDAMGIRGPRGGVPWWMEEAIRKRDEALRALAKHHIPESSVCAQARRIHTLAVRYAASSWRFDQQLDAVPLRHRNTSSEYLWLAFKSGAPMPIGERQLRNILAH